MSVRTYILICAARNEEAYIERTILAVGQTRIPIQWLIISDGSTDRTGEIVQHYSDKYPFIRLHAEKWGVFGVFLHPGIEDYEIVYHPLFFFMRALRRFSAKPWILGSIIMLSGYAWAGIKRKKTRSA